MQTVRCASVLVFGFLLGLMYELGFPLAHALVRVLPVIPAQREGMAVESRSKAPFGRDTL